MSNTSDKSREEKELQDSNRSVGEGTPFYFTTDSTLQSPEEHAKDQSEDPKKDTQMEVSNDDLHEIKAGKTNWQGWY